MASLAPPEATGMPGASRAFEAITCDEERHAILARSHLALAAKYRLKLLANELLTGLEDLERNVGFASKEALADPEAASLVSSAKSLHNDAGGLWAAMLALSDGSEASGKAEGVSQPVRSMDGVGFEEERHTILGKAHLVLAGRCRQEHDGQPRRRSAKRVAGGRKDVQELVKELDVCLATVANEEIFADRSIMLVAMAASGRQFHLCSSELRDDLEIALAAIANYPKAWHRTSRRVRADRTGVLKAVEVDAAALKLTCQELQNDREIVLAAVSADPWALEYASDDLKADHDVVLTAVSNRKPVRPESVLQFACPSLQANREIVLAAVTSAPAALCHASQALRADREVVLTALKHQTRQFIGSVPNVLAHSDDCLRSDEELVLEALRVDGAAAWLATKELREDKDFLLRAMRVVPVDEREECYEEAHLSVQRALTLDDFNNAADSALAAAGEDAPVVTISLATPALTEPPDPASSAVQISSCEVILLSGKSFTCSLLPELAAQEERSSTVKATDQAAARKPPRSADSNGQVASQPCSTVGHLAKVVVAELPKHVQADLPTGRIFILFSKSSESEAAMVTAWDWNRSLSDFI